MKKDIYKRKFMTLDLTKWNYLKKLVEYLVKSQSKYRRFGYVTNNLSLLDRFNSFEIKDLVETDVYEAEFSNLGITGIPISEEYPEKFDRLLCGGIWCIS